MNKMFEKLKVKIANTIKELKGDIIVSDSYQYDYKNQKEIKQLYPNNDGINVVLDFRDNDWIVEGHKIPSEYNGAPKYILDDTFLFDPTASERKWGNETFHDILNVIAVRYKNQSLELLNKWFDTHNDSLWIQSPTRNSLLVIQPDKQACIPQELLLRCRLMTISRIAIVETPWTQKIVKKNGHTSIKQGADRRLHVYFMPVDIKDGLKRFKHDEEVAEINRKLKDFVS